MESEICARATCNRCTKVTCPSCQQERMASEISAKNTCKRCTKVTCSCCQQERMVLEIIARGTCNRCTKVTCPSCPQERMASEISARGTCNRCAKVTCPSCQQERMASQIAPNGTCQQCTKVTCPSCRQERVHSEFGKHATCQRCRTICCPCCNLERMPCEFNAGGADQRCVHCQAAGLYCASCNKLKQKTAFTAAQIALGSNKRCIHCSQKQKKPTKRSKMHYNVSLVVFNGCVQTLQKTNGNLVPNCVVLPVLLQKVSINLTNMRKARGKVCIPCSIPHKKVSTKSKQPTFHPRPSLVMMKNMHYPREKRDMLFTKMSQLVIDPNFSPMTMKSMYYIQSELRRTIPKNGLMTIYNLNLPTSAKPQRTQDTASSSNMTKVQCLLDLPIASYPAKYRCMNIWTRTILKWACNCLGLQTKLTSASNIFTYQ